MGKVISLGKTARVEWTATQKKLWNVLQEEKNRDLLIGEICRLGGYCSYSPWYDAMRDDTFRACVEALGISIRRQASPLQGIIPLAENADEEWQKDFIATMEDLKRSKQIADEKGWEMYENDLADQINGMELVLAELQLPAEQRSKNRGGVK